VLATSDIRAGDFENWRWSTRSLWTVLVAGPMPARHRQTVASHPAVARRRSRGVGALDRGRGLAGPSRAV